MKNEYIELKKTRLAIKSIFYFCKTIFEILKYQIFYYFKIFTIFL